MRVLSLVLFLAACKREVDTSGEDPVDTEDTTDTVDTSPVDADGDGIPEGDDCNDADSTILGPTATYADTDGDGYGKGDAIPACTVGTGFSADATDCDDTIATVHPGATETCNGLDDDCANGADDGLVIPSWYLDSDEDGFGAGTAVVACEAPAKHVLDAGDCDDTKSDITPGAAGCGVPLTAVSCADALSGGEATTDGVYTLPSGIVVWCDMTTDGGGWTGVARVLDEVYDPAPPPIGTGADGTWEQWTAHEWRSGESYYLPLDTFDALTDGTSEVMQLSRDVDGNVLGKLVYADFDYDAVANTSVIGTCTDLVGTPCAAGYSWKNYPPGFNGWGRNDYCNQAYPTHIWNYHPETGCASASGLFVYNATDVARPQNLGVYTSAAYENLILVR